MDMTLPYVPILRRKYTRLESCSNVTQKATATATAQKRPPIIIIPTYLPRYTGTVYQSTSPTEMPINTHANAKC